MSNREVLPIHRSAESLVQRGANQITALQDEVNRLFRDFMSDRSLTDLWRNTTRVPFSAAPVVDIVEKDNEFRITAEVPGMDAKDLKVTVSNGYLTVKGEKKQEHKEEKAGYYRHERSYGSFERTIALPETANLDKAEASVSKGVLNVSVPKKAASQTKERTLEVKQAA